MYVKRSHDGQIEAISKTELDGFCEKISDNSFEIKQFLANTEIGNPASLVSADIELVRVLEDVIHLLTEKGLIQFTDLPDPAQKKLLARDDLRKAITQLNLINDESNDETIHI